MGVVFLPSLQLPLAKSLVGGGSTGGGGGGGGTGIADTGGKAAGEPMLLLGV